MAPAFHQAAAASGEISQAPQLTNMAASLSSSGEKVPEQDRQTAAKRYGPASNHTPGLKKALMLALACGVTSVVSQENPSSGLLPTLPELPPNVSGDLTKAAMSSVLRNPGANTGDISQVRHEIFRHGHELRAADLAKVMNRYQPSSVRAALMNADPCGDIAVDPDQALELCHRHPDIGMLMKMEDPTAQGRTMPIQRPDAARAAEFNAAYLTYVQAHQKHLHLQDGLLPVFTVVEQLREKWHATGMTAHLRYFGGERDSVGTHVFMDKQTLNRNSRAMFDMMCHELGHVAAHPAWEQKMYEITGTYVPFANEIVVDHFALEACGQRLGDPGGYQRAGGEKLFALTLQAITEQHQPATDALLKANELVKMALFDGDPAALKATGDAIALVGKMHPELLRQFEGAKLSSRDKVMFSLLALTVASMIYTYMTRDNMPAQRA